MRPTICAPGVRIKSVGNWTMPYRFVVVGASSALILIGTKRASINCCTCGCENTLLSNSTHGLHEGDQKCTSTRRLVCAAMRLASSRLVCQCKEAGAAAHHAEPQRRRQRENSAA